MLIGIIGESCSGKSTLAEKIRDAIGAEVMTGKDYLRLAGSEAEAGRLFQEKMKKALTGDHLIYVISEQDHLALLPEGAVRILVLADLDTIKARFRARMRGNLPGPVEKMLERKHGRFDSVPCDYRFDGESGDARDLCRRLVRRTRQEAPGRG